MTVFRVLFLALVVVQACSVPAALETLPASQPVISVVSPPPTLAPSFTPLPTTAPPTPIPTATVYPVTPFAQVYPTDCLNATFSLVAFFPDNQRILQIFYNNNHYAAQIIHLRTGALERTIDAPYGVMQAALSPDGRTLAWALEDHVIYLLSLPEGKTIARLEGHLDRITDLKYSSDGSRLFSASTDRTVRIWSSAGEWLGSFQPTGADNLPSEPLGIGVSPDGNIVATIPFDGPVKLWDLKHSRKAGEFTGAFQGGYDGADAIFSPDGQYLAVDLAGGPGSSSLWRLSDGVELWRGGFSTPRFSPDGRFFAYSDRNNKGEFMVVLRTADGQQILHTFIYSTISIGNILFSPDGQLLAADSYGMARIWQLENRALLQTWSVGCSP